MRTVLLSVSILALLFSCNSFDSKILGDVRYTGGQVYGTNERIKPRSFRFNDYTFVTGSTTDSGKSSLGLYNGDKEIYYETSNDGVYDTIIKVNLNSDGILDFLISYQYEDGATLFGMVSQSANRFSMKQLIEDWSDTRCIIGVDTLKHILPLQIKDLNNDGKDDLIINLVIINNHAFSIPCTDTVITR